MLAKAVGFSTFAVLVLLSSVVVINRSQAQEAGRNSPPVIPKTWDEQALATVELPLASTGVAACSTSPGDYYYRMPVRPIYKSYPIYAPGREPPDT